MRPTVALHVRPDDKPFAHIGQLGVIVDLSNDATMHLPLSVESVDYLTELARQAVLVATAIRMQSDLPCPSCDGQGEIGTSQDYFGQWHTETCRDCQGSGYDRHGDQDEEAS